MTFGLPPPKNVKNLFCNWLAGIDKRDVKQIRVGVCAIIWAIWNARSDKVFNKTRASSILQVIPVASHWIRMWSYLQPVEVREPWILGATIWRRSHGSYSANSVGGVIIALRHAEL
jgi:hypothetical protein